MVWCLCCVALYLCGVYDVVFVAERFFALLMYYLRTWVSIGGFCAKLCLGWVCVYVFWVFLDAWVLLVQLLVLFIACFVGLLVVCYVVGCWYFVDCLVVAGWFVVYWRWFYGFWLFTCVFVLCCFVFVCWFSFDFTCLCW